MSTMKFNRKPPLPRSPLRQRPRRVLRSSTAAASAQTPPGSLRKSQKLNPTMEEQEPEIRPEYQTISWELRALAKMVNEEIGNGITDEDPKKSSPLFERGRFYEVYSARRNERLKRKKGEIYGEEAKTPHNLGVAADSCKKRDTKKLGSLRKSMAAAYAFERSESAVPRYSLRSMSKENKKPPLAAVNLNYERSVTASERKVGVRRARKI